MSAEDVIVRAVERLAVSPGDTIVLRVPRILRAEDCSRLAGCLQTFAPPGVNVLVLDGGMEIAVVEDASSPLSRIRAAMLRYEQALDQRQHGGVAAGRAIDDISAILAESA